MSYLDIVCPVCGLNHHTSLNIPPCVVNLEALEEDDLKKCELCGENAWDGRICHACGLKEI
jgi:hypothetical protein